MNLRQKYDIPNDAVITIAGTVGVGKSTMTTALANALGYRTSFEKVDSNPYLDKFYADFTRWSFHLQVYFLAERFKEQKEFLNTVAVLFKIALSMKTLAFCKNASRKGTMTETDYETYKGLFDAMVMTPYFPHPDLLIYLEGSFDDIVDRIQERGRPMEQQTPIEYWKEMHGRYENWINNFNSCPVLRLNINEYDILKDGDSIEPIIKKSVIFKTNT